MLTKLLVTAAAAATVSVPLAGVAWANTDSNSPPGQNTTGPGVPQRVGTAAQQLGVGDGSPLPPGEVFKIVKDAFPNDPTPVAYGKFIALPPLSIGTGQRTAPGLGIKTFTPACSSGKNLNVCTPG